MPKASLRESFKFKVQSGHTVRKYASASVCDPPALSCDPPALVCDPPALICDPPPLICFSLLLKCDLLPLICDTDADNCDLLPIVCELFPAYCDLFPIARIVHNDARAFHYTKEPDRYGLKKGKVACFE